jgi:hypothetical protein
VVAPITETFDGISLSDDSDGDNTRSFGESPRIINSWTIRLLDSGGLDAPGDGGTPSYLDVTGNAVDTDLVGGPGDNALTVNGWFGVAAQAQFSATTGEEFWLESFAIVSGSMAPNAQLVGYRDGVAVVSQNFEVTSSSSIISTSGDEWKNIDEFRIIQQDGASDISFFIDDITVANAVPNVAPVVSNLDGDGASFTEDGAAILLDAGSDATVVDSDSADFDGGSIVVAITADGTPGEDVLSVQNEGSVAGQVGVSGSSVLYGGGQGRRNGRRRRGERFGDQSERPGDPERGAGDPAQTHLRQHQHAGSVAPPPGGPDQRQRRRRRQHHPDRHYGRRQYQRCADRG